MIHYLLITLATACFGGQIMVTNGYQKHNGNSIRSSLALSAMEGPVACLIFFALSGFKFEFTVFSMLMAMGLALVGITCSIAGIKTVSKGSISVYTLFMMGGGMIVPFLFGAIFLSEEVTVMKIIGILLMTLMLTLPIFFEKDENGRSRKDKIIFYILAFCLFFLNGFVSVITKIHQIGENAVGSTQFTAYYFFFMFAFALIAYAIFSIFEKKKDVNAYSPKINKKGMFYASLFAIINGGGSFFNIMCAKNIPATIQFPIVTGGTIIFSALFGWIFFKEKMTKLQVIQLITALIASVLFVF